jgi:hypothetical protein
MSWVGFACADADSPVVPENFDVSPEHFAIMIPNEEIPSGFAAVQDVDALLKSGSPQPPNATFVFSDGEAVLAIALIAWGARADQEFGQLVRETGDMGLMNLPRNARLGETLLFKPCRGFHPEPPTPVPCHYRSRAPMDLGVKSASFEHTTDGSSIIEFRDVILRDGILASVLFIAARDSELIKTRPSILEAMDSAIQNVIAELTSAEN